jgi:hypothetical protein
MSATCLHSFDQRKAHEMSVFVSVCLPESVHASSSLTLLTLSLPRSRPAPHHHTRLCQTLKTKTLDLAHDLSSTSKLWSTSGIPSKEPSSLHRTQFAASLVDAPFLTLFPASFAFHTFASFRLLIYDRLCRPSPLPRLVSAFREPAVWSTVRVFSHCNRGTTCTSGRAKSPVSFSLCVPSFPTSAYNVKNEFAGKRTQTSKQLVKCLTGNKRLSCNFRSSNIWIPTLPESPFFILNSCQLSIRILARLVARRRPTLSAALHFNQLNRT